MVTAWSPRCLLLRALHMNPHSPLVCGCNRTCYERGMSWPETKKAAKLLGYSCITKRTGSFELDDSTGLLHVYVPGSRAASSHAVYLWEGRVIEPMYARTQLWLDCSAFLTHYKYSAGSLMIVTAMEGV
jgi:hypothetical protein